MKKLPLTLIWILCYSVVYGQSDYQLSLTGQRINITVNQIWINEIIDVRNDKSNIGFVQKGISNARRNATFEKSFESELKDFINSNLKLSENPLLVALRVNHFHISEETRFSSEFAYAEISVDLLVKAGESYHFVKQLEAKTQVKGMDVTSKHPKNIAAAFEEIFANVNSDDIKSRLGENAPIHKDSLEISSLAVKNLRILEKYQFPFLTENMKDGFYNSFYDFRDNKPSDGPNIYLLKKDKSKKSEVDEVIPYYSDSNKKLKDDYWGFCLNDTIYIQADKKYFPLEFDGNSYTFYAYRGSDPNYYNPSAGAAATAGILGGAIAGAAI